MGFNRFVAGAFNVSFIGSTCTALTWSRGRLWLVSALMMSKFHLTMKMGWSGAGRVRLPAAMGLTLVHSSAHRGVCTFITVGK